MQAIVTELVFEHALRIRMKAGTNDGQISSIESTAPATPGAASQAGDGDFGSATPSSSTSSKGKGKAYPELESTKRCAKPEAPQAKEKNIIGRINNLVSSDLNNLDNCSMYFVQACAYSGAASC